MEAISKTLRVASHAGSWYTDSQKDLEKQLAKFLENAKNEIKDHEGIKAIIGPHAGYEYSGPTAGWCYQYLKPKKKNKPAVKTFRPSLRVFLLGPCHHVYMQGLGLSSLKIYATPIGNIDLDLDTIEKLNTEGKFNRTNKRTEEDEHSLEMHLPLIRKVLGGQDFRLVPIMVGEIEGKEEYYGKLLAPYFDDPETLFIISSDFCHWGSSFQYTYYKKEDGEIYQSIEKLDRRGMNLIEAHDPKGFEEYFNETDNTICGRNPIMILLNIIKFSTLSSKLKTKFVRYAQSNACKTKRDTSVSYAAGITYLAP